MNLDAKQIYSLKIGDNPFREICHTTGGIHKAIQILNLLTSRTEFFYVNNPHSLRSNKKIDDPDVKQYCMYPEGLRKLTPFSRVWTNRFDISEITATTVFLMSEFLDGLEYTINHGVFVPENIYFQTMGRIELLRGKKKPSD